MEIDRSRRRRSARSRSGGSGRLVDRFADSGAWLDRPADAIQKAVDGTYGALGGAGQALKNLMTGTALIGHPLHPAVTDIPIGSWTMMVVADWLAITTGWLPAIAGDAALAVGLAGAVIAALSGLTDYAGTAGREKRVAVTHGTTMLVVIVLMAVSLGLRIWSGTSMRTVAVEISTLGWLGVVVGGYLGGHLAYGLGSVVNHNAFASGPADYTKVGDPSDFKEGQLRRVTADGLPVLVVRINGSLRAIGAVCSHAGGPLDEGKLEGDAVTCPWHGSKFCLDDGRVRGGPATFDQPALLVRETRGAVEVRLSRPLH